MNPRRSGTSPFREWRRQRAYDILPVFPLVWRILCRVVGVTSRISSKREKPVLEMLAQGRPFVLAFFHGRLFLGMYHLRNYPLTAMIGISYLGEIQSRTLLGQGQETVLGSKSKGGAKALAQMVKAVRSGRIGAFAVDGPRGPYGEVKEGVVYVAKKLGVPVVPVMISARPSLVFKSSWDRFMLPMPFSKAVVVFGSPMMLDGDMAEESMRKDCQRIRDELEALEKEADEFTGKIRA